MTNDDGRRWHRRPAVATGVRAGIFLVPVTAAVLAGWLAGRAAPTAPGPPGRILHAAVVLVTSTLALVVMDRAARRLVPLARLLDLTLLFPDRAPSRIKVARDAARRRPLDEQLRRLAAAHQDPNEAAREILTLVAALDSHDRPTRGHAERVRLFTDVIADEMHLPQRDRDRLRWAALLHDIGKLTVPSALLNKPGKPDEQEWRLLQSHPAAGTDLAAALMPWLGPWGAVIAQHHERYDGTGYPAGLAGTEISPGARIVSVADSFDVMTAVRAYRRPVSRAAAYRELVRCAGTQFDPDVVRALVSVSAPRLRRAQGLLAWLGDIPVLATHTVPAATLARAVGAGAMAVATPTLAATPPATLAGPPAAASTTAPAVTPGPHAAPTPGAAPSTAQPRRPLTTTPPAPVGRATPSRSAEQPAPAGSPPPASPTQAASPVAAPTAAPTASDPGGSGSGTSGSGSGGSGVVGGVLDGTTDTVGGVLDSTADTVGEVLDGATGTVTDTVGGVVGGLLGR